MAKSFHLMPGPKGLPLFGSALAYSRFGKFSFERMHLAKQAMFRKYGPVYKETLGPAACLVQVFTPEDTGAVFRSDGRLPVRPPLPITIAANEKDGFALGLGSLNGDAWYDLRKSVQKLLMHPLAASRYLPAQNQVADDFLDVLEHSLDKDGYAADFLNLMTKYTMESIASVCFNTRLGCLDKTLMVGSEGYNMLTSSAAMFEAVQKTTYALPWYMLFRTKLYRQFANNKRICNGITFSHIEKAVERKSCPMATGSAESSASEPTFLDSLLSTDQLQSEQAVGITTDLFIAGIDSTANALSFVVYNLARNPDKQEILAEEINRVLPVGSDVTHKAIEELAYMKACVKESFRLNFPIEGGTTRILQQPLVLGGYEVPKGTLICLNNQTMCLSEAYFIDPQRYLPERWLKETSSATQRQCPPFIMLPFGFGSRMCIGRRFAEQEIYLAVVKLVHRFRMQYEGPPLGMLNRVFNVPDGPLKVKLTRREHPV